MIHCQRGKDMLMDLKRSEWLPPFDDEGFRTVIKEMNDLFEKIYTITDGGNRSDLVNSEKVCITYYLQCIHRDKRYLYAFLNHRLHYIRRARWETGAILPEHLRRKLSSRENEYFTSYSEIIGDYCNDIQLDLTCDLEPPKDLLIEIRVVVQCGDIMTENGTVNLDIGTTHFLRRNDVEHLIRQGKVEHVQSEGYRS